MSVETMDPAACAPYRFTVEDLQRMSRAGILADDERVELIQGQVVVMSPIGVRHAHCVRRLRFQMGELLGRRYLPDSQNALRIDDQTQLQPDLVVLAWRDDLYATDHPGPGDALLVIEVAKTSYVLDRDVKAPLYAQAGIPELWILDLERDRLVVLRDPQQTGYAEVRELPPSASVEALRVSGLTLGVAEMLGLEP